MWFFWQLHKLFKCFRGKKKISTWKTVFQSARCSPKRWLQHCTAGLTQTSRYHIQPECQGETAQQQLSTCEKEKEEGRARQKGDWGKPSLPALQRIWAAEKRNRVSKCQTNAVPAKPHLIPLNQQKKIIHCLISLTSPIKGWFFPLLGQSPCCKIPALISAFNNMCCTSAQKESS